RFVEYGTGTARSAEQGTERIGHWREQGIGWGTCSSDREKIRVLNEFGEESGRDEIAVARTGVSAKRKVVAAVCGVVHAYYDLTGQQPLDSEVPLIDVGILRLRSAQVVAIAKTPLSQFAVFLALWRGRTLTVAVRKRIGQGCRAGVEVVGCK